MITYLLNLFTDNLDLGTSAVLVLIVLAFSFLSMRRGVVRVLMLFTTVITVGGVVYFSIFHIEPIAKIFVEEPPSWILYTVPAVLGAITFGIVKILLHIFVRPLNLFKTVKVMGSGFPGALLGSAAGVAVIYFAYSGLRQLDSLEQIQNALNSREQKVDEHFQLKYPPLKTMRQAVDHSRVGKILRKYDVFNNEDKVTLATYMVLRQRAKIDSRTHWVNADLDEAIDTAPVNKLVTTEELKKLKTINVLSAREILRCQSIDKLLTDPQLVVCLHRQLEQANEILNEDKRLVEEATK